MQYNPQKKKKKKKGAHEITFLKISSICDDMKQIYLHKMCRNFFSFK